MPLLTRRQLPGSGRHLVPEPERDCAESQSQRAGFHLKLCRSRLALLRLVCDTAALLLNSAGVN
jgi:hypothetical protein